MATVVHAVVRLGGDTSSPTFVLRAAPMSGEHVCVTRKVNAFLSTVWKIHSTRFERHEFPPIASQAGSLLTKEKVISLAAKSI
jgi:hypothetical protein